MKGLISVLLGLIVCMPAFAASPRARVGTAGRIVMPVVQNTVKQSGGVSVVDDNPAPYVKNTRDREREACLNNNIGIGDTFVWASKYSSTGSYATMVEDTDNPENNVCFVKVGLKSDDKKVSVDDIPSKYFMWGDTITCGSWVDQSVLEKHILDGKKTARVLGTIGGTVGGAAVGVGAMEAFGNKLLAEAGKEKKLKVLQGQEALDGADLLKSQMLVLKENNVARYNKIVENAKKLGKICKASSLDLCEDNVFIKMLPGLGEAEE